MQFYSQINFSSSHPVFAAKVATIKILILRLQKPMGKVYLLYWCSHTEYLLQTDSMINKKYRKSLVTMISLTFLQALSFYSCLYKSEVEAHTSSCAPMALISSPLISNHLWHLEDLSIFTTNCEGNLHQFIRVLRSHQFICWGFADTWQLILQS